jgi:hypothetical protein
MIEPLWMTAFIDLPASSHPAGQQFWQDVTGYAVSPARGRHLEFTTLEPPDGDAFLRVQRLRDGAAGIHLDLHVADLRTAADLAAGLGAREEVDLGDVIVLRSPGGLPFCLVGGAASVRPAAAEWADGATSLVDQVCLDIPAAGYDAECSFWSDLTGWELRGTAASGEFRSLERPPAMPIRLLLQRLGESSGPVRAHLDLASSNRTDETLRHARLGATVEREFDHWTVLRDPAGAPYCITDRDPRTGVRPQPESGGRPATSPPTVDQ